MPDVTSIREDNATGNRRTNELVAADGEAVDPLPKIKFRCALHKGEGHSGKGAVAVNVALGNCEVGENFPNLGNVINTLAHRRANIRKDDWRDVTVNIEGGPQIREIDLAARERLDHDVRHLQHPQNLGHAVVGILTVVTHPAGVKLTSQVKAIHVALRPSIGDVAPVAILGRMKN